MAWKCALNKYTEDPYILEELISVTAEKLGLAEASVVEKDFYVTQAIDILTKTENQHFKLIFQGGTCLAKAHHLIQRMSEDCDFRIIKKSSQSYGNDKQRQYLREFRKQIVEALQHNGFIIDQPSLRVHNEGQFIEISAQYPTIFPVAQALKPHLALEFFLSKLRTPPEQKIITTMIRHALGEKINHPEFIVDTMSVEENAAEKWVALTRRVSATQYNNSNYDHNLIRHLYDLYIINTHQLLTGDFSKLVIDIIKHDSEKFKSQNPQYYQNPAEEIKLALEMLKNDSKWQVYWNEFMQTMIFGSHQLNYHTALTKITELSNNILSVLEQ